MRTATRVVSIIAPILVAALTSAQKNPTPYVMSANGAIFDVVYDVTGFQPLVAKGLNLGPSFSAGPTSQSLLMACLDIDGTPKTPSIIFMHECLPNGGAIGGGMVSYVPQGTKSLTVPDLDVNATQNATFGIECVCNSAAFTGFATTSAAEKTAVKVQKKWLPANFRLTIPGLPTTHVSKVNSFTIQAGFADWNGDGVLDYGVPGGITFTVPVEDSGPFQDWFNATASGTGDVRTLEIDCLDEFDNVVFTSTEPVIIDSVGFGDLFLGTTSTPGRDVSMHVIGKGIILCPTSTPH